MVTITMPNYGRKMMLELYKQYEDGRNCDLELRCQGNKSLHVHKCIIDICFRDVGCELEKGCFYMDVTSLPFNAVQGLINFIYCGKVIITPSMKSFVRQLLHACHVLGFEDGFSAFRNYVGHEETMSLLSDWSKGVKKGNKTWSSGPVPSFISISSNPKTCCVRHCMSRDTLQPLPVKYKDYVELTDKLSALYGDRFEQLLDSGICPNHLGICKQNPVSTISAPAQTARSASRAEASDKFGSGSLVHEEPATSLHPSHEALASDNDQYICIKQEIVNEDDYACNATPTVDSGQVGASPSVNDCSKSRTPAMTTDSKISTDQSSLLLNKVVELCKKKIVTWSGSKKSKVEKVTNPQALKQIGTLKGHEIYRKASEQIPQSTPQTTAGAQSKSKQSPNIDPNKMKLKSVSTKDGQFSGIYAEYEVSCDAKDECEVYIDSDETPTSIGLGLTQTRDVGSQGSIKTRIAGGQGLTKTGADGGKGSTKVRAAGAQESTKVVASRGQVATQTVTSEGQRSTKTGGQQSTKTGFVGTQRSTNTGDDGGQGLTKTRAAKGQGLTKSVASQGSIKTRAAGDQGSTKTGGQGSTRSRAVGGRGSTKTGADVVQGSTKIRASKRQGSTDIYPQRSDYSQSNPKLTRRSSQTLNTPPGKNTSTEKQEEFKAQSVTTEVSVGNVSLEKGESLETQGSIDQQEFQLFSLGLQKTTTGVAKKSQTKPTEDLGSQSRRLRKRKLIDYRQLDHNSDSDSCESSEASKSGYTSGVLEPSIDKKSKQHTLIDGKNINEIFPPVDITGKRATVEKAELMSKFYYFPPAGILPKGCKSKYGQGYMARPIIMTSNIQQRGKSMQVTQVFPQRAPLVYRPMAPKQQKVVMCSPNPAGGIKETVVVCHPTKPVVKY